MIRWVLIVLLFFNSLSALLGGVAMLLDPSGEFMQFPPGLLENSPFQNYLIPGFLRVIFIGLLPLLAAVGLIVKEPNTCLPLLPLWTDHHWAWTLAVFSGVALVIFILVEISMIGYWAESPIQAVYGASGLVVIVLSMLARVRLYYQLPRSKV